VLSHVVADVGPDAEQHALALVVASAILVGFAEVTRDNRSVDRRDDLGQRDALSRSRQYVAAADTTLGAYETDALQTEEDLFEVRLG
jgi:hypothetical protein